MIWQKTSETKVLSIRVSPFDLRISLGILEIPGLDLEEMAQG